jgi:arginyl-tRNA synthetase
MNLSALLIERFTAALSSLGYSDAKVPLSRSTRPEFGDYQFNGAMALAKQLKKNPREIAQQVADAVALEDIADKLEIAGPGFINIHLSNAFLSEWASDTVTDTRLSIAKQPAKTVVVDYSSPNLAKEMHVGHLRSTIIGDATVKVLEFLGHKVIRQNHMGDWGTQFGMLLAHFSDELAADTIAETALSDLEDFYRAAKVRFDEEQGFADRAREYVVKLQSGDAQCMALWEQFIDVSIAHSEDVYTLLNVSLKREDVMGESAYNEDLPAVIESLQSAGIAVEDQGAQVVFLPEMADKEGNPAVYIVQKSGGGYLYATTDLAAIRYRNGKLNADRTLIFTDARQSLHFKQTEIVARKAGFIGEQQSYEHCPFGMMLGKDGKPFKTRTGGTVKLHDLLVESVERAESLLKERNAAQDIDADLARKIGIGAVKYADLSKNRTTDYVFDWDNMLSFEGNTAPYLQYAYTRIMSIFDKLGDEFNATGIDINDVAEKELATKLMQFEDALMVVASEATPHALCAYLYDLASSFMRFYEACPILKSDVEASVRDSRLGLAQLTANTLNTGLTLLGIETANRM